MNSVRELIDRFPRWLQASVLGKILYVAALHFDLLVFWAQLAVWSKFPGYYSFETLPLHARERQIDQGIGESLTNYAKRLESFLETHATRGNPYALLGQIYARYRYAPDGPFVVHLFYPSGMAFDMDATGAITRTDLVGLTVDTAEWAHWFLVYEWPVTVDDDGTWDDEGTDGGFWDSTPDGAWDTSMRYSEVQSLRLIPTKWNNAHSIGHLFLLGPGQALWDVPDEDWNSEEEWDEGGDADVVELIII